MPSLTQLETLLGFAQRGLLSSAFRSCLMLELDEWSVSALAAQMKLRERTLRKYFFNENLPSPQWLLGWTKLLLSAYLLADSSLTVEDIANRLEYSTPSAYRRALKTYIGSPANALRGSDGPARVADGMRAAFSMREDARGRHHCRDRGA